MMEKKRAPINTKEMASHRLDMVGWLFGGAPDMILEQEAQGQRSLIESDTLPVDISAGGDYDPKAILESAGMRFLGGVDGDPLFQYVELPYGWKKVSTNHPMHSKLIDGDGRERAGIFYKAAFYDRRADMRLVRRFDVYPDHQRADLENVAVAHVFDCGQMIYTTEPSLQLPEDGPGELWKRREKVIARANNAAVQWLNNHYPDWRNPGAYWD